MFVIIVGGGNIGSHLAKMLLEGGHTVKVIDERPVLLRNSPRSFPRSNHRGRRQFSDNAGKCRYSQSQCISGRDRVR